MVLAVPLRVCLCLPPLLHAGVLSLLAGRTEMVVVGVDARPAPEVVLGDMERLRSLGSAGLLPPGVPRVALARHRSELSAAPGEPGGAYGSDGVTCVLPPDATIHHVVQALDEAGRGAVSPAIRVGSLSPREADVVREICRGRSNAEIGDSLHLSVNSVKTYVRTAYRKMGVTTRSQAVRWGIERGLG